MNDHTYLYVEDDLLSREALNIILTRVMKLERVYIFENSENFLEKVKALPHMPDVFLLDIHVYPHSGFEMLAMLREDKDFSDAIVVALTASVMNEEVDQLRSSGFDGVIGKPLSLESFPALLRRVINRESIWHITDI